MDVREKYVMQKVNRKEKSICPNCIHHNLCIAENNQPCFECNRFIDAHGVTVQEWIPVTDVPWLGEDISKLCIRYMTEYADFHGYASQKKVKAHIIRLLQAEADGRIAIMPQPPKGE